MFLPQQMTTYAKHKQNFLLDIKRHLTIATSGGKQKMWLSQNSSKTKHAANGKQLTVGNMTQANVTFTQDDLNKHQL